jgi:hypothetical protein
MSELLYTGEQFEQAFNQAVSMMRETPIEPTSAFKQSASDAGIEEGTAMGWFVELAWKKLYGKTRSEDYAEFNNSN